MVHSIVEILMATYNGDQYVSEQIESIINQSYTNWHLTISDDWSTDSTFEILAAFESKYPEKLSVRKSPLHFGNAKDHFFYLMKQCNADYIFFCDQDDVWFENKLELFMLKFKKLEHEYNRDSPLLVFSDQTPTDKNLKPISVSLMKYQNQNPYQLDYRALIFQNVVTGGAMAINRVLCIKSCMFTSSAGIIMHDWWIAIVAALFGHLGYIPSSTSFYRQHGDNSVGAKKTSSIKYIVNKTINLGKVKEIVWNRKDQTINILNTYTNEINDSDRFLSKFIQKRSGLVFYLNNKNYINGKLRFLGLLLFG